MHNCRTIVYELQSVALSSHLDFPHWQNPLRSAQKDDQGVVFMVVSCRGALVFLRSKFTAMWAATRISLGTFCHLCVYASLTFIHF